MLDIKWIRENPAALDEALRKRGADPASEKILALDESRRAHLGRLQEKQERRNAASKEIGNAMRAGDQKAAERLKEEVAGIKAFIQKGEAEERRLDHVLTDALALLPNIPLDDVPLGGDESGNFELRTVGEKPRMNFAPKEHYQLGEAMGLMDFERAAKLSGSRFTILMGELARLDRALGQFMLDLHTSEHGYTEVQPPLLVRDEAMFGTGQLPKFSEDLYPILNEFQKTIIQFNQVKGVYSSLKGENEWLAGFYKRFDQLMRAQKNNNDNVSWTSDLFKEISSHFGKFKEIFGGHAAEFDVIAKEFDSIGSSGISGQWLIPTAEVPLTNLVREEILEEKKLPLRFTALTPCFRSEAGAAGRDTRGMLRQHQFYKVELVSITDADSSIDEHERMTRCAETVLEKLGLPFRTMVLCTGDMGFGARKTYDIEVWLPGQNTYREISSCSACGDFQARRMNARYRGADDRAMHYVHTLNGSGVAVGRALIAVLENYQNADGSVTIPETLRPYMGGQSRIGAGA